MTQDRGPPPGGEEGGGGDGRAGRLAGAAEPGQGRREEAGPRRRREKGGEEEDEEEEEAGPRGGKRCLNHRGWGRACPCAGRPHRRAPGPSRPGAAIPPLRGRDGQVPRPQPEPLSRPCAPVAPVLPRARRWRQGGPARPTCRSASRRVPVPARSGPAQPAWRSRLQPARRPRAGRGCRLGPARRGPHARGQAEPTAGGLTRVPDVCGRPAHGSPPRTRPQARPTQALPAPDTPRPAAPPRQVSRPPTARPPLPHPRRAAPATRRVGRKRTPRPRVNAKPRSGSPSSSCTPVPTFAGRRARPGRHLPAGARKTPATPRAGLA
ncbi:uncharacterized protein LOC106007753 [Heterocephalus glaber]|uniref:Uncharacterized protein LOC106007753 n=1 Tax=Heterocephalus glaber TaxID=10181 RepID=A0AAX6QIJ2_HETGA|nr:uncharacterized protein LOC106007753 [Heterocephalus glaber]